jgi:hypothetical protein
MACCACLLQAGRAGSADDGADGRKRILDAVVQLLEDQLRSLSAARAPGVDAGRATNSLH